MSVVNSTNNEENMKETETKAEVNKENWEKSDYMVLKNLLTKAGITVPDAKPNGTSYYKKTVVNGKVTEEIKETDEFYELAGIKFNTDGSVRKVETKALAPKKETKEIAKKPAPIDPFLDLNAKMTRWLDRNFWW
jgi:hypothetical protein